MHKSRTKQISKRSNPDNWTKITCKYCGDWFYQLKSSIRKRSQSFCSKKCLANSRKTFAHFNCSECGKDAARLPSKAKHFPLFCSKSCAATYRAKKRIGEKSPNWKGGIYKDKWGYIRLNTTKGRIKLQHRLVMEEFLGRSLEPWEHVHHKNEDRADNSISNLQIVTPTEHKKIHWELEQQKKEIHG